MFENSDLKDFWNSHEYYTENYVEEPLTDEIIAFYENTKWWCSQKRILV